MLSTMTQITTTMVTSTMPKSRNLRVYTGPGTGDTGPGTEAWAGLGVGRAVLTCLVGGWPGMWQAASWR